MRVIIAGSRNFNDYKLLKKKCNKILKKQKKVVIISGHAEGADKLGERYAEEKGYRCNTFPAPWWDVKGREEKELGTRADGTKYWKGAGPCRNEVMANIADALIAFPIGRSPGTRDMIERAKKHGLKIRIIE